MLGHLLATLRTLISTSDRLSDSDLYRLEDGSFRLDVRRQRDRRTKKKSNRGGESTANLGFEAASHPEQGEAASKGSLQRRAAGEAAELDGGVELLNRIVLVFGCNVMLDAWVANQDRHHQNWGAVLHDRSLRLAPTFDHGASLARNLEDEERKDRLTTRDQNRSVEHFAGRARSGFYSSNKDGKTMLALDVFRRFAKFDVQAAGIWLGKLSGIKQTAVDAILAEIPPQRMSPVTREFTLKLLMINQRRLLESP